MLSEIWRCLKALFVKPYDDAKFWRVRHALARRESLGFVRRFIYTVYYEREMRRSCADIALGYDDASGTAIENFATPPNITQHGLNGIVIAGGAKIGRNVTISHQVTIGRSRGGAPVIGDNVYIGPGAKIFGDIKVGDNVNIGANCIVFQDIPDNSTVVLERPRVILRDNPMMYYTYSEDEYEMKSW